MNRIIPKLIIMVLTAVSLCIGTPSVVATSKPSDLNQIMTNIGNTMVKIYPLVVAKRSLNDGEIQIIDQALGRLTELFTTAKPFINQKSDGYQISYEFVLEYLKVVRAVLASRRIDYARTHLYALGEICTSCHTQDTTLRTLFSGTTREHFDTDYAYAEFNYMTRNYAEAVYYYEKSLASPAAKTELEIIQPLQRIITIYTQVNNKPADGIVILKKYLGMKDHTAETRAQLQSWISGLEQLSNSGLVSDKPVTFTQLQQYTARYLGEPDKLNSVIDSSASQEVQRVWLRGQLYHYLNRNPATDEIPVILYWLSVVDRSIAYNYFFSMTDLYLKQCVLKYPHHAYAQRCFKEYQAYVDYTYTRNGDPIPAGIKDELKKMLATLPVVEKN